MRVDRRSNNGNVIPQTQTVPLAAARSARWTTGYACDQENGILPASILPAPGFPVASNDP